MSTLPGSHIATLLSLPLVGGIVSDPSSSLWTKCHDLTEPRYAALSIPLCWIACQVVLRDATQTRAANDDHPDHPNWVNDPEGKAVAAKTMRKRWTTKGTTKWTIAG